MTKRQYINMNGKYFLSDDPVLKSNNRQFCYGDGIFETIRCNASNILHFDDHFDRLIKGLDVLKIKTPKKFTRDYLKNEIRKLISKNRIFKGGRIRLSISRETGGYYTPEKNGLEYLIEARDIENEFYMLNEKGFSIDIYSGIRKEINILSNIKSSNSLLYVMASVYKQQSHLDDVLILNSKGNIIESATSNVFFVKNRTLYTPPLSEGCIAGISRKIVKRIAPRLNLQVNETSLDMNLLENADEILLSNAISGIRWVLAYKHKRFFNKIAKEIIKALNHYTFSGT